MAEPQTRVLVADKEPFFRDAIRESLREAGIACEAVGAAPQVIEAVRDPQVGVLVLDVGLDGGRGVELLKRLRSERPALRVIVLSDQTHHQQVLEALRLDASDYLAKPWDDEKLVLSVRNLLKMRGLQLENRRLHEKGREAREALAARHDLCGLIYESDAIHRVVTLAVNVGASDQNFRVRDVAARVHALVPEAPVVYTGEGGADPRDYRVAFDLLGRLLPGFRLETILAPGRSTRLTSESTSAGSATCSRS